MSETFKKHLKQSKLTHKVEAHRSNKRAGAPHEEEVLSVQEPVDNAYAKINAQQRMAEEVEDHVFQPQTKIGGAFYLPINKSPEEVFGAVVESWEALNSSDFSANADDFEAHGFMYVKEKFTLARTKLTMLDEDPQVYLEINKMEGDGFTFADQFKIQFTEPLLSAGLVEDVPQFEPVQAEEDIDDDIQYLDFNADVDEANQLMQRYLTNLKPGGGVAYDNKNIFEAVSILGFNSQKAENLEYLRDFQDHIVSSTLEVLRLEDMNFIPTVYYGSKLINTFLQDPENFDEDLVAWSTFLSLVDAMKKHCFGLDASEPELADEQVMQSRQSYTIMMDSLKRLSNLLQETELTDDVKEKILKDLDEEQAGSIGSLLP